MATQSSAPPAATAPWETKRGPNGNHLVRRSLPWLGGLLILGLIVWGLWPKPVVIETGTVARGPLTVRVSEEGKTRVRNRYVVAAPVAGKMRRVPLKPGDEVKAGETILTAIEPTAAPLLDPRARAQAEAVVSMHEANRRQAAATLEAKQSALKVANADRDRMRSVTLKDSLSESDRDKMEGDASMRAAEVRAAEFSLQVIDYELAQARAALERPEGNTVGNLVEVKSPVSGRVLKVIQESEMVVTPEPRFWKSAIRRTSKSKRKSSPVTPWRSVRAMPWRSSNGAVKLRSRDASAGWSPPLSPRFPRWAWKSSGSSCSATCSTFRKRRKRWETASGWRRGWRCGMERTCSSSRPEPCSVREMLGKLMSIGMAGRCSPRSKPVTRTAVSPKFYPASRRATRCCSTRRTRSATARRW